VGNHVLQIDCPDEMGLISRITGVLYEHSLNIVSNQEFVDAELRHFVMRTEFEGGENSDSVLKDLSSVLPKAAKIKQAQAGNRSIIIMATKEPHCLGDLLLRCSYGEIPARVDAVISNHEELEPLARAFDIPFHYVSHKNLDRRAHEQQIQDLLDDYCPDYLVLAKYMRIFSPEFVARYNERIVNIL
jgi:formyltetrahydrofolate deformylase